MDAIVAFLRSIGLGVERGSVDSKSVLPGIAIARGTLVYDPAALVYPGDLLHEAGHLAVMAPADRAIAHGSVPAGGGDEMAAIAWSYAAARHLGLAAKVVFHDAGYRGGARGLIDAFEGGGGVGVPMLQYFGMAARADETDELRYPAMRLWLRGEAARR